jgi:hypothetical protein
LTLSSPLDSLGDDSCALLFNFSICLGFEETRNH